MLSVEEARARILAAMRPVGAETVPVSEAWGRVLAAPVTARLNQPPADVSAMDGYALRAGDAVGGGRLRVLGAAPAGRPYRGTVGPGEAVRLFTGSLLPPGADTVLLQEDADAEAGTVLVRQAPAAAGQHIRRMGQDFTHGQVLLHPGRRLGARDVGLAAAANYPWLPVHRRPRVAILATGDEVALPGEPVGPGGIISSNSHTLAALVRAAGGEPVLLPLAGDSLDAIGQAAEAAFGTDLLVTTGGVSVGDHDLLQAGLATRGFVAEFWKVAMRPGKPMVFGRLGAVPVLGLPGNPVSAFVCAVLFLSPALQCLSGLPGEAPTTETALLGAPVRANDSRADHLRAALSRDAEGRLVATPFVRQDSAMLRVLAEAGALVMRAPHAPALSAGEPVRVVRLDGLGL